MIVAIAGVAARPAHAGSTPPGSSSPALDSRVQLLLVVLGLALAASRPSALTTALDARPLARAGTTLAVRAPARDARLHRPRDGREPRRGDARARPRRCRAASSRAIGLVVHLTVTIAVVGLVRVPGRRRRDRRSATTGSQAPLVGIVDAFEGQLPAAFGRRAARRRRPHGRARSCFAAATTSISGLHAARPLARRARACCRATFGRLNRRTLVSPQAIVAAGALAIALVIGDRRSARRRRRRSSRASYSFGVLLAFTAAQLAVIRLRVTEPELERPFRAPLGHRGSAGVRVPLPAARRAPSSRSPSGSLALATHPGARYAGPAWLARRARRLRASSAAASSDGLLERVDPAASAAARAPTSSASSCR